MSPKKLKSIAKVTKERRFLNEKFIPHLRSCLKTGDSVYEIGKSCLWDYSVDFEGFVFKTVDINETLKPDIVENLEDTKL